MMYAMLITLLLILMLLIGGERGGKSFIALVINTVVAVVGILLVSHNVNAILVLVVTSFLFCMVTLVFQNGWNVKTIAALAATVFMLVVISIIIIVVCLRGHITGLNEIESRIDSTEYYSSAVNLNMLWILLLSMVWGELGAVTDTAISITSALHEIKEHNPRISRGRLFASGMLIGKDIIGTTVNTLVFVAIGESIMLLMLYFINNYSFAHIVNSKSFLQEISVVLFSCIGCILVIPVSAVAYCIARERKD